MTYPPVAPSSLSSAPTRHLPVELLESIFSYACIDGGPTGRSLSLVSSHFREVACPIRFQYIALSGVRHIKSFLACFTRERAYTKVRVHHLLLSTWRDGEDIARIRTGRTPHSDTLTLRSPRSMDGPRWSVWMPIQETLNKELSHLLPFVLNAVAHDLSTLSIVQSWEFGAIQLPESFPLLREFTFCGPPPIFPGGCVRLSLQPSPCFPSLRHLHIVCGNISTEFWVHHSPALTHLRLSDLNCGASTLADELRRSLGIVLGRTPPEHQNRPPLAHIRLQCRAVPRGFYEAHTSAVEHNTFVRRLKTLRPHPTVRVDVLRDRHYRDRYWDARIRRDWQDALLSGPGWWVGGEEREEGEDEVDSNAGGDGYGSGLPEQSNGHCL